jgi:hypothetical protein
MSERGQVTVLETSIGLIPIVMTWALVQGAIRGIRWRAIGPWVDFP